ncbi:hypothetical protein ABPG77_005526 [Micractinium sp. CCAP 211/92]
MMSGFGQSSLPLGSLAGIPIRLHITFPILFALGLLAEGLRFSSWTAVGFAAILYGPLLLVTVLIHELGHSLAARRLGGHAEGILLWPLGGLAYLAHSSGPKADLLISLAGPLTHLPQFAVWLGILFPVYHAAYGSWAISLGIPPPSEHFGLAVVAGACQLNIGLAAFNLLLPAYPLDGGRIFADCLLLAGVGVEKAAKATVAVATVGALAVIGLGFWLESYLSVAVGIWMLFSTLQLWQVLRAGGIAQHPLFAHSAASSAGPGGGAAAGVGQARSYQRYDGDSAI